MNRHARGLSVISLMLGALAASGCDDDGGSGGGSGGDARSSSNGTAAATTGATGGSTDPSCTPLDGQAISVACGIFVNTDAPEMGNGKQESPFRDLATAMAASSSANARIYVCGDLDEAVDLLPGREVYGEIDCATGWIWDFDARATWTAPADTIPLRAQSGEAGNIVSGFDITARDAAVEGGSSIAVLVDGGTLRIARSSVAAGSGEHGAPGIPGTQGTAGPPGAAGGVDESQGALGGVSPCGGGTGGKGAFVDCPGGVCACYDANPASTGGTTGQSANSCTLGDNGAAGTDGAPGEDAIGLGTIGPHGFFPALGTAGGNGMPGKPGGGGGAHCLHQEGGGGGGAGGCGGTGSSGGQGGGSSFAFVSLDAEIHFESVTAAVGSGGNGRAGGHSPSGGTGGMGGAGACTGTFLQCTGPAFPACSGGKGGDGGDGGKGGSAPGGHAAIIAYIGIINELEGLTYEAPTPAQAGASGGGMAPAGQAVVELPF